MAIRLHDEEPKKKNSFGRKIYLYSENCTDFSTASNTDLGFKDQLNIITFSFGGSVQERQEVCESRRRLCFWVFILKLPLEALADVVLSKALPFAS